MELEGDPDQYSWLSHLLVIPGNHCSHVFPPVATQMFCRGHYLTLKSLIKTHHKEDRILFSNQTLDELRTFSGSSIHLLTLFVPSTLVGNSSLSQTWHEFELLSVGTKDPTLPRPSFVARFNPTHLKAGIADYEKRLLNQSTQILDDNGAVLVSRPARL